MELSELKRVIETLLFTSHQPLPVKNMAKIIKVTEKEVNSAVKELSQDYATRTLQIQYLAEGYQMTTRQEYAEYIKQMYTNKITLKLSRSALETLTIIAYKQPITKAEIENIRGVDVTDVLNTLMAKKIIDIVGRKETLGRPILYGTTKDFLRYFGLGNLSDLPNLDESINAEIETE